MRPTPTTPPTFDAADILLSDCAGGDDTWVSCPYAVGLPELFKKLDGKWDKFANAWSIPKEKMDDFRKKLPKVVELVRVQQAVDLADGKPARPVNRPYIRRAGPVLTVPLVGEDWLEFGTVDGNSEVEAARALGAVRKTGTLVWYVPDAEVFSQVKDAIARVQAEHQENIIERKEMEAAARERQDRLHAAERERRRLEKDRTSELIPVIKAAFGPLFHDNGRHEVDYLEGLAEIASVWPTARFLKTYSKLLDGRGQTGVRITTPSGRKVPFTAMATLERTRGSRRIEIIDLRLPVFAAGSGFITRVTTTDNQKTYTRDLTPYVIEAVTEDA